MFLARFIILIIILQMLDWIIVGLDHCLAWMY